MAPSTPCGSGSDANPRLIPQGRPASTSREVILPKNLTRSLWTLIEPLLPATKPRAKSDPGRPRVSDRAALNGVLFVFKTGIRQNHLPTRLDFGSGATCWRRLNDWQKAGIRDQLHELLLDKWRAADQIDYHTLPSIRRRCAPLGRAKNGPESHRSCATGFQAPHPRRCQRRSCRRDPNRRQRQRRHAAAAAR